MTEIEILASRVRDLGQSVDLWNKVMIRGSGLAAIAAVVIGVSTRMVVIKSGQQSEAQTELMHAKDVQLAIDLFERDQKIEEAHTVAADVGANLEREKQKTARFQKEADQARLAVTKETERLAKAQRPRILDGKAFVAALKGKPRPASVVIWYKREDEEAYTLAIQIFRWLGRGENDGAGWNVSDPIPAPDSRIDVRVPTSAPADVRLGAWYGLGILSKTVASSRPEIFETKTPLGALFNAFTPSGMAPLVTQVPSLPDGTLVIFVSQKQM